jgi:tetratricopeptide (TPR) repeat protein
MRSALPKAVAVLLGGLAVSAAVFGQTQRTGPPTRPSLPSAASPSPSVSMGSLIVYLRTQDGQPLPETAVPLIRIQSTDVGVPLPSFPTRVGDGWLFTGLPVNNDYEVEVSAVGYLPGQETASIPDVGRVNVIVFLRPADQELVFRRPTGQFVLAPKAAKEIQRAVNALQSGHFAPAQKHVQKAMKLAPGNPYVQYVMGMTYLLPGQFAQAKPYLETSVSIDPQEAPSLSALGTVRYRLRDYRGAIEVLTKAVQLDAEEWRAEWLLASAYLGEKDYAQARNHAERALQIDKDKAAQVRLVLGQTLAALGDRAGATAAFEAFAAQFPKDPNAPQAREWARTMREAPQRKIEPAAPASLPLDRGILTTAMPPQPPVEAPPSPHWAPPDVDAAEPFLISGAACPLKAVLRKAGENAQVFVHSLQEFSATEDFQAVELKHGNELQTPFDYQFEYLVFIDRTLPDAFDVEEFRQKGSQETRLPGKLQDLGAPALALAFHPVIQKDLDWSCEGLGTWDDQPAWVIRFEQKPKAPNVLSWFYGPSVSCPVPLKGRAWVSERSSQVLHLDTDLVSPIAVIDLKRQHTSIDYAPVSFRDHNVQLWLPKTVDTYIQFEGHFLHHYHRYSNFRLFWVGTQQKIDLPKADVEQQH